jgi:Kef-type K+ transport system membrane component KefB
MRVIRKFKLPRLGEPPSPPVEDRAPGSLSITMKSVILYVFLVGIPLLFVFKIVQYGQSLTPDVVRVQPVAVSGPTTAGLMPHVLILLLQVGLVLALSRLVGCLFRRLRQPQVMGEMVAGILLGPSVFGIVLPSLSAALFPPGSLGFLSALSQIGLVFYMFLVGLRLEPEKLKSHSHVAVVTSHASIIVPFALGNLLALYLYPRLSDASAPFIHFSLFVGTAMSITAFPVLARILTDLDLVRTRVGSLALACAAVDDVSAWCILAGVILLVRSGAAGLPLWVTIFGTMVFAGLMFFAVRPALRQIGRFYGKNGRLSPNMLALVMCLMIAAASATEALGIHALFGAFVFGVMMPKDSSLVATFTEKLEGMTVVLLLPLFFALTGLRTSLAILTGAGMWYYCLIIIGVAILGKLGGSMIAARMCGMPWREAGALGILMNTRGLMELVVLNIGLDIGAISSSMFTMMVLMAILTTFMATPILEAIYPESMRSQETPLNQGLEAA